MVEMTFEEKLKYLKDNYDGIASMAYYNAQGGVKCKVMSWACYLSCVEELMKKIKEFPELLNDDVSKQEGVKE